MRTEKKKERLLASKMHTDPLPVTDIHTLHRALVGVRIQKNLYRDTWILCACKNLRRKQVEISH